MTTSRLVKTLLIGSACLVMALTGCGDSTSGEEAGGQPVGGPCANDDNCAGDLKCCSDPADPVGVCQVACGSGGTGATRGLGGAGAGGAGGTGAGGNGGTGAGGAGATGGSGGSGATGGSGGSGATGGSGGSGGGPTIAPHTVTSGSVTMDGNNCLVNGGSGVLPAILHLNQAFSGKVTLVITGMLSPSAGGVGLDTFAIIQSCTGGVLNGNSVEQCVRGRATFNALDNSGLIVLYDAQSNELMSAPWTPTAASHAYKVTITSDPTAQTLSIVLEIDGKVVGTLNATSVGLAAGDQISILLGQGTICTLMAS